MAALFLQWRLQRLGFQPPAHGVFLQPYGVTTGWLEAGSGAGYAFDDQEDEEERRLTFGEEWYFLEDGFHEVDRSAQVFFLGDAPGADRTALSGHWALAVPAPSTRWPPPPTLWLLSRASMPSAAPMAPGSARTSGTSSRRTLDVVQSQDL